MIKITIENKEYNLPEGWDEVMFGHFIDVQSIIEDNLNSPTLVRLKTISTLSGNKDMYKSIDTLEWEDRQTLSDAFDWVSEDPNLSKTIDKQKTLDIDGDKFTLKSNFNKFTIDEQVMIEELIKSQALDVHQLEVVFGVLFRKLNEDGTEMEPSMELLKETIIKFRDKVYLRDIYAVILFFSTGEKNGKKGSTLSSAPKMTITKVKKNVKKGKTTQTRKRKKN